MGRSGGFSAPGGPIGDPPNPLRHYAAVVRRRWKWVALGVVVGLLAGFVSTFLQQEVSDPTSYYKATNTLIVNGSTSGGASVPNLQQTAFLVRSADVTGGVSTALGISVDEVNENVSAIARNDVLSIDVTAISTDRDKAVLLADTAAGILSDFVATDQQRQFSAQRDEVLQRLDDLRNQRTALEDEIARNPTGAALARAELDSVINQYRLTYEQLQGLAEEGGPTGGFSTLQTASPVQINARAYNARLEANRNDRGSATATATPTAPAFSETDLSSSAPVSTPTRMAIGGLTGLILGLVTAFVVEAWDDRLRRRDRVEAVTGLPVIAEVPALPKDQRHPTDIPAVDSPRSRVAERYRAVRTSLLFVLSQHQAPPAARRATAKKTPPRSPVVMITSPSPGEGKTTTLANVAAVFGDSGTRTLVIDCDYRKPSIGRYLAPVSDLDHPEAPAATRLHNVWFIPAPEGDGSPAGIITELRRSVDRWRDEFDLVLLDTPPMLTTNDATDLLAAADSVLLVLRAGQTRTGPAERVSNLLMRYRADVLGVVLNSCSASELEPHYGYYYGEETAKDRKSGVRQAEGSTEGSTEDPAQEDPVTTETTSTTETTETTGTTATGRPRRTTGNGANGAAAPTLPAGRGPRRSD